MANFTGPQQVVRIVESSNYGGSNYGGSNIYISNAIQDYYYCLNLALLLIPELTQLPFEITVDSLYLEHPLFQTSLYLEQIPWSLASSI